MTLDILLGPHQFEFDGDVYDLADLGGGQYRWQSQGAPGQPGDSTQVKGVPIEMQAGFGATHRIRRGNGTPSDPAHHAFAENVIAMYEGLLYPAPRITYIDAGSFAPQLPAFRIGGYPTSIIGGTGTALGAPGAFGGGSPSAVAQYIRELDQALYVHCINYTMTINPNLAAPTFIEARNHGDSAIAKKSDVFGGDLYVGLGPSVLAEVVTSAATGSSATTWEATQVNREVYTTGVAGRLFSSLRNKVYNVLPGADAKLSAAYLPSNGEVITDSSDPIRSLTEFSAALVAGTARQARTLDPNRGYQGVPLTAENRLSASEYDGRGLITNGPMLLHATMRGVQMMVPGRVPQAVGPELLHHNATPYVGMEWGVPDFLGDFIAWPAYFPESGDSVIFFARLRGEGDVGTGPIGWHDALFLEQRECRCVRLWGGSADFGPRLFFGAGSAGSPYVVGWCDLGAGGGPEPFTSSGQPVEESFIETALDDLGLPGVNKNVERVELPYLHGADSDNYLVVSARGGHDGSLVELVGDQSGAANGERIASEGFARVFTPVEDQVMSQELALRFSFHQDAAATSAEWLQLHGNAMLYYTEVPDEVEVISTLVDAHTSDIEEAQAIADRWRSYIGAGHKHQRYGLDGADRWAKVTGVQVKPIEVNSGSGDKTDTRLGIEVVMREVMTE